MPAVAIEDPQRQKATAAHGSAPNPAPWKSRKGPKDLCALGVSACLQFSKISSGLWA